MVLEQTPLLMRNALYMVSAWFPLSALHTPCADLNEAAFSTRGYLRQEENQYLANDIEKIKELPMALQKYAGYGVSKPFMGWVDLEDPVRKMNPGVSADLEDDFW